ncbi:hypothetical protein LX99_00796 [Mucilaginibacter oryzae]|uniref:Lipoprotein n=1 Tax=Mucilaginibacter oryzae TaxID=468058 RepID=A0A316HJV5_9SPHI|nr:hypothetical protein [Mucilaginibacter oryzae]PWK80331.1 hypothetical protein LX99_00796 [Mucilaginibacter oryzae]
MPKNHILFLFTLTVFLCGCTNNARTNSAVTSHIVVKNVAKPDKVNVLLTDSAKLLKHLDSLPKATFPRIVSDWNRGAPNINLAEFKTKTLFKLSYKRIPRAIGGAGIDDERIDSTFNLCDTNYRANWFLVAKTPKFFVVEVDDNYLLLVTIDYNLNVIEAIHIAAADPSGNNHFHGELTSTIYKNLKIVLHYAYSQQGGEEEHYRTENEDDIWRINKSGHFKAIRYRPDGVTNF